MKFTQTKLILSVSLFLLLFDNYKFFHDTISIYDSILFIISLSILVFSLNSILFILVSSKFTTKPILIFVTLISSLISYFMNNYSIIIDSDMIRNAIQTNFNESYDLLNIKLILYLIVFGIIPSYFIYKVKIDYYGFKKEFITKIKIVLLLIVLITINLFTFGKSYASFFREHKPLRYNTNPTYWIYSIGKYIQETYNDIPKEIKKIAIDAKIIKKDNKNKLVVVVVGEAARADHFSLNGYKRETNQLLKKEDIINFTNFYSCGTSTAVSVPCMFSVYNKSEYNYKKGISTQNIIDILNRLNIAVLWRDNNSDSKGVAVRIKNYQDYKTPKNNKICDIECRDEGMLIGLDSFIKNNKNKDILIVLHQMGNHGPAYYKRYPKRFEKFKPICKTSQLEQCSKEEIINAYDNAILYTDYFLSKTINFLKQYKSYKTTLLYMSDHGESLGENGIYLHGLPYFIAPNNQKHIGAILWSNDKNSLSNINTSKEYNHDYLFHTLLYLFDIKTKNYNKNLNIMDTSKNR